MNTSAYICDILNIWSELLDHPSILPTDNFMELGGSSIKAISMLLIVSEKFSVNISMEKFFENPTPSHLEKIIIASKNDSNTDTIIEETSSTAHKLPLLPAHHNLLKRNNINHYNCPHLFDIPNNINVTKLKESIAAVINHHEGLRVILRRIDGEWMQCIQPFDAMNNWWVEADLSNISLESVEQEIEKTCTKFQGMMDIEKQTLFAVHINLGKNRDGRLFLLLHHLIVDRLSELTLLKDIQTAYSQVINNKLIELPPHGTKLSDWSMRVNEFLTNENHKFYDYWANLDWENFKTVPLTANLNPQDEIPEIIDTPSLESICLSEEETKLLNEYQKNNRIDASTVVISSLARAYQTWADQGILYLAIADNGRNIKNIKNVDLLKTIAWLINIKMCVIKSKNENSYKTHAIETKKQLDYLNDDGLSFISLETSKNTDIKNKINSLPTYHFSFNFVPSGMGNKYFDFFLKKSKENYGKSEQGFSSKMTPFFTCINIENQLHIKLGFSPYQQSNESMKDLLLLIKKEINSTLKETNNEKNLLSTH